MSVLSTFGLFLSISAFATPKVGDSATYNLTQTSNGQSISAVRTTDLIDFNAQSNQYLERDTTKISGRADDVQQNWMDASNFLSDASIDNILANCAAAGGTPETITVPAGTFSTCNVPVNSSDGLTGRAWVAKVTFGLVRAELSQNGINQVMELVSFK